MAQVFKTLVYLDIPRRFFWAFSWKTKNIKQTKISFDLGPGQSHCHFHYNLSRSHENSFIWCYLHKNVSIKKEKKENQITKTCLILFNFCVLLFHLFIHKNSYQIQCDQVWEKGKLGTNTEKEDKTFFIKYFNPNFS